MAYSIRIGGLASQDEYEAYEWYEQQLSGLGEKLLAALEVAYNKIANHPENYSFIDGQKELRDYLVNTFPYLIIYRINADTVEVVAIHHAKKHPSKRYRDT